MITAPHKKPSLPAAPAFWPRLRYLVLMEAPTASDTTSVVHDAGFAREARVRIPVSQPTDIQASAALAMALPARIIPCSWTLSGYRAIPDPVLRLTRRHRSRGAGPGTATRRPFCCRGEHEAEATWDARRCQ